MADLSFSEFNRIVGILWGTVTRGDQFLSKTLSEAISHAAARSGRASSTHIARELHLLFLPLETMGVSQLPPAHTLTKRLHKQWAYHHCVHSVLSQAYPLQAEGDESVAYALYVLHAVKNLTVAQYEADADKILRIALTAMQKAEFPDVEAAFAVVLHILSQDPRLVKDHVASIVTTCKHVYTKSLPTRTATSSDSKPPPLSPAGEDGGAAPSPWTSLPWGEFVPRAQTDADRARLREKSVVLLRRLGRDLDEMDVRAQADEVMSHLETVLGDQFRYIRQLAQVAKSGWMKLQG